MRLFLVMGASLSQWIRGRDARSVLALVLGSALSWVVACGAPGSPASKGGRSAAPAEATGPAVATVARAPERPSRPRIVVLGDSLTAGLGLMAEQAYPALLQRRLDEQGYAYDVVNAGVSGDTTAGGLRRLDWALDGDVRFLIVALGGNDGLRGLPITEMKRNLSTIIAMAQGRHIRVVLAGIEAPPNFGEMYTSEFRQAFRDVARDSGVAFVPFLLTGVAGIPGLNQSDGIHPTAEGAQIIANTIWSALEPMLGSARTS